MHRGTGARALHRPELLIALGTGVAVALLLVAASWELGLPPPATTSLPAPGTTSLGGTNGTTVNLTGGYLGVNIRDDHGNLTSSSTEDLAATPARTLRWPGGGLGDRTAILADNGSGLLYNASGAATPASGSLANFGEACEAIDCESIVTLPGEIDNASYAASVVAYSESVLDFYPAYWEVGNEPALWTHFGVPWANWTDAQDLAPTPSQYASEVQAYARAIHAIDPSARVIGLGGVGKGGRSDAAWIGPTVSLNGPNLSAVAIHVYPQGSVLASMSVAQWFSSLTGTNGLPDRVAAAQAAITQACSRCSIGLLVDEFGPATNVTASNGLQGGAFAAYLAAMVVQGLTLPVVSIDFWVFQSGTYGAWFATNGQPSPSFELYSGILDPFGPFATSLNVSAHGLLAAQGGPSPRSAENVLLVNTNSSTPYFVDLSRGYPDAAGGVALTWGGNASSPTVSAVGAGGALNWTVPPDSLVLFEALGPRTAPAPLPGDGAPPNASALTEPPRLHAPMAATDAVRPRSTWSPARDPRRAGREGGIRSPRHPNGP